MADSKLTALTADTAPTTDDIIYVVNDPAGTPVSRKVALGNLYKGLGTGTPSSSNYLKGDGSWATAGGDKYPMEFRMTLTSGTAVTTSNVTAATTIYITPFRGNQIGLYSSGAWVTRTSAEFSIALGTITSGLPYDVFVYDNAGTPTAEKLAWTSGTARATALTTQDGVLVKSGDATRRYIGTFYTTSTTTTEDSDSKRFLWNYYNRVQKNEKCVDTTDSWIYTTATWRASNASTAVGVGRVECVVGVAEDMIDAFHVGIAYNASGPVSVAVGVGIDSTSTNSATMYGSGVLSYGVCHSCNYKGMLSVGYHYVQRLEISQATGTTNWIGDAGSTLVQSGMNVQVWC